MIDPFRRNIVASYASQFYVSATGILMVPVYLHYLGKEAYGLIGFYTMMQSWFLLLDAGLTPTMARETARFHAQTGDSLGLRQLLRALEGIFTVVSLLGIVAVVASSGFIASRWLNVNRLPLQEVQHTVAVTGLIMALRWASELYRGVVTGFERLVWLGTFNIVITTVRSLGVIPVFWYVGTRPSQFFFFQLVIAALELFLLILKTYRLIPPCRAPETLRWEWKPLSNVIRFALSMAFTGSIWVICTQTDKLVLSRLLSLSQYGQFTIVVLVASGIVLVSTPISGPLMPRLVALNARSEGDALVRTYRQATQLVAVIVAPATLVLSLFSRQVLWCWTGDAEIARNAAPALTFYALGNGLLAVSAFPYYLQYAIGDLRLHLIGSGGYVLVLIPTLILTTNRYGMAGAGAAWLGANIAYFLIWVPVVHHRFVKGLHGTWLWRDLAGIALGTAVVGVALACWVRWPDGRLELAAALVATGGVLLAVAAAASSAIRERIGIWHTRWLNRAT